ncbi:MAG: hypothetical protein NTW19_08815 [Planctomycetota bacterium]|nr:hypothetical protein [Planctomycetota bacterium]
MKTTIVMAIHQLRQAVRILLLSSAVALGCGRQSDPHLPTKKGESTTQTQPNGATIETTRLSDLPTHFRSLRTTEDGAHFICIAGNKGAECAVIDGQSGSRFDQVAPEKAVDGNHLFGAEPLLSEDGEHTAYVARKGRKWQVVIDGHPSAEYDQIGITPPAGVVAVKGWFGSTTYEPVKEDPWRGVGLYHSARGKRIAYVARQGDKWVVVVDGRPGREFDEIYHVVFSRDGSRFGYAARSGEHRITVIDGELGPEYDAFADLSHPVFWNDPMFSPDGKHVAYRAMKGRKMLVVADGKPGQAYDAIGQYDVHYSPSGNHLAYQAYVGNTGSMDVSCLMVIDEKPGPLYKSVTRPSFTADDSRVAYWACTQGNKEVVVTNNEPSPEYDKVFLQNDLGLVTPDGKHVVYGAVKGSVFCLVKDGRVDGEYQAPRMEKGYDPAFFGRNSYQPIFSPDGQHMAMEGGSGNQWFIIRDGIAGPLRTDKPEVSPFFSQDLQHDAYATRRENKKWVVVVDGTPGPEFEDLGRFGWPGGVVTEHQPDSFTLFYPLRPIFSPNSSRVGYVAKRANQWLVVVDGHPGPAFDHIGAGPAGPHEIAPLFSPDSKRVVYTAMTGKRWCVVVDGRQEPAFDQVDVASLVFSRDSRHLAYQSKNGGKSIVVVDGQPGASYDQIAKFGREFDSEGVFQYVGVVGGTMYHVRVVPGLGVKP